jgi:hypothetical protein
MRNGCKSRIQRFFVIVFAFVFLSIVKTEARGGRIVVDDDEILLETKVAKFLRYDRRTQLFGKMNVIERALNRLERPKMQAMATFVPRGLSGEVSKKKKKRFGFTREAYVGGHFVSGASPDLDVGILIRIPREAFVLKSELEKMTSGAKEVEWFVFGDENPGELVAHESAASIVFAKIKTPMLRGKHLFEIPLKLHARYPKPVSGEEEVTLRREEEEEQEEKEEETKILKTHAKINFPEIIILVRREKDTSAWTKVMEVKLTGLWYIPFARSNLANGVKIVSLVVTLGAGFFVFKTIHEKINKTTKRTVPSVKAKKSKK